MAWDFTVCGETYSRWPISRKERWVASSGTRRSSALLSGAAARTWLRRRAAWAGDGGGAPGDGLVAEVVELGVELAGLGGKAAEVGPPAQQVVDLAQDLSGG